jgi:hypothetical protein
LKFPEKWAEVRSFLKDSDFYSEDSKVHVSIFRMVARAYDNAEKIDETILNERISALRMSFEDPVDVSEYISSLYSPLNKLREDSLIPLVKELKKFSAKRCIIKGAESALEFAKGIKDPNLSSMEMIRGSDEIYSEIVGSFEFGDDHLTNLAEKMEEEIERMGNNPQDDFGMMLPEFPKINEIFGSLFRPGNITCIVARAKTGKSTMLIDWAIKACIEYGCPVIHFDNGEMSEDELVVRMTSAMSGIPTDLLESGRWRTSSYGNLSPKEVVAKVRGAFAKIKGSKFYYKSVAGMSGEEMAALLENLYFSKVGRGKPLIFSFDYLKTDFKNLGKGDQWAYVGKIVHAFKQTIQTRLVFGGKPAVSMLTACQSNRMGITNGRSADQITDDESVVGLSDNITQFVSHLFLLRKKIVDEIVEEGERFGTHKLIPLVCRHLGRDKDGYDNPVRMPDGTYKPNSIHLNFENFGVTECGDTRDLARHLGGDDIHPQ